MYFISISMYILTLYIDYFNLCNWDSSQNLKPWSFKSLYTTVKGRTVSPLLVLILDRPLSVHLVVLVHLGPPVGSFLWSFGNSTPERTLPDPGFLSRPRVRFVSVLIFLTRVNHPSKFIFLSSVPFNRCLKYLNQYPSTSSVSTVGRV